MKFIAFSFFALMASVSAGTTLQAMSASSGKCLEAQDNNLQDGTPVVINDCNGSNEQQWAIFPGETSFALLNDFNFCVDGGNDPSDGTPIVIKSCVRSGRSQGWFLDSNRRIEFRSQWFCLSVPSANMTNGDQVEIRKCKDGDVTQAWFEGVPPPTEQSSK